MAEIVWHSTAKACQHRELGGYAIFLHVFEVWMMFLSLHCSWQWSSVLRTIG